MNTNSLVVISGEILDLVMAAQNSGHVVSVAQNRQASGNSHTTINFCLAVRVESECAAIAHIYGTATDSYGFGYKFKVTHITPSGSSNGVEPAFAYAENTVESLIRYANQIAEKYNSLKGVEWSERSD